MLNKLNSTNFSAIQLNKLAVSKENTTNLTKMQTNNDSTAAVRVPLATLKAYSPNLGFAGRVDIKFFNSPTVTDMIQKFGRHVQKDIGILQERVGKPGQFLNWIGIVPKDQLKRIDHIYTTVEKLQSNGRQGKLGVIGIGGSKHTVECSLGLTGLKGKVELLSATDPVSIKDFLNSMGDLKTANFMVASKSGTTLEPSHGYKEVKKALTQEITKQIKAEKPDISAGELRKAVKEQVSQRFVTVTDGNAAQSKLRQITNKEGYLNGIIHDDCGGRFSIFDDHSLMALAYSGMPKNDMQRMLKASLKAQKQFTSTNLTQNLAAQKAMFNVNATMQGKTNSFDCMFGERFKGATLWNTQLKNESIKAQCRTADFVGPDFLHYNAEADLDPKNRNSFYTLVTVGNKRPEWKTAKAINTGVNNAYAEQHPVARVELKGFTPEDIGEFLELNHFETIYTGMLLRSSKGIAHPPVLPEVLQPNVEKYKVEVKKALAQ